MSDIKNFLKYTWSPFFARFGTLTPVQTAVIPVLLSGENVIVCSPTATGKTEAVVAPLIERLIPEINKNLILLYIAPTKALLNNLLERLKLPLEKCGFKAIVRTGDKPYLPKGTFHLLFITPESFDSLLCRQKDIWQSIKAIVIDEIHFLDNTYRGDQLRVLLKRLLEKLKEIPQFAALSATLFDPKAVATRYFYPVKVIEVGQPRSLKFFLSNNWAQIINFLKENKWLKAIIFCNRRKDVESLYLELSRYWPKDRILTHHASLSYRIRKETEQLLRQWRWGLCICTSTLEIGIDIGDFDVAICYHPPPTPSAFQQRIGRASRQKDFIAAIGFYENEAEAECFNIYAGLAVQGMVEPIEYIPDLSVIVQQTFSMLFAQPSGIMRENLFSLLSPLASFEIIEKILIHLLDTAWIEERRGKFFASEKLMNLGERGVIHSNIPQSREFRVIEMSTQKYIGEINLEASEGNRFILGGKLWEIQKIKGKNLFVQLVTGTPTLNAFRKRFSHGAFTRFLPKELQMAH